MDKKTAAIKDYYATNAGKRQERNIKRLIRKLLNEKVDYPNKPPPWRPQWQDYQLQHYTYAESGFALSENYYDKTRFRDYYPRTFTAMERMLWPEYYTPNGPTVSTTTGPSNQVQLPEGVFIYDSIPDTINNVYYHYGPAHLLRIMPTKFQKNALESKFRAKYPNYTGDSSEITEHKLTASEEEEFQHEWDPEDPKNSEEIVEKGDEDENANKTDENSPELQEKQPDPGQSGSNKGTPPNQKGLPKDLNSSTTSSENTAREETSQSESNEECPIPERVVPRNYWDMTRRERMEYELDPEGYMKRHGGTKSKSVSGTKTKVNMSSKQRNTVYVITPQNPNYIPKKKEILESIFYMPIQITTFKDHIVILTQKYHHMDNMKQNIPFAYKSLKQYFTYSNDISQWLNNFNPVIE